MGNKLTDEEVVNALGNMRSTDTVGFFYDKENKQYVYATAKEVFDLIHRQKAEIERLTEIRNSFRQEVITLNNEKLELQKQVDDLKKTISIKEGYIDRVESEVVEWQIATKKAVKDTAKEIYSEIGDDDILVISTKEYGKIEVVPLERLQEIVKGKCVEGGMMFQRVVYRIVPNHACNDFNKEPKTIKVKYFVVGESQDGKSWLVEKAGWQGKANRHYVKKSECTEVQ